ncbi:MAG: MFS transporter [Clostridia bacterium]|nr:MFS transporter [Clostridia bacterium]
MNSIFETPSYKKSRGLYTAQCMFEYFIAILMADAFLAKLLKSIGLSDALTGILSSLISVTFLFQLLSIPLAGKIKKVKKPMIILDTLSQLLFAAVYIVPFLSFGTGGKGVTVTILILLAYLMLYLNSSICYKWGNSFVMPENRGTFSAVKEMISLLGGVIFTLAAGFILDRYEENGNLEGGFRFTAIGMAAICVCNFICFFFMDDKILSESTADQSAKVILKRTFLNKNVRNAMLLTGIVEFAKYFSIGFMGTYKTIELGFSVGTIQIINVVANMCRFFISKPLGKYSDKHSFSDGYFLGILMSVGAYIIGIFTTPKTRWLIIAFTVIINMSYAGTGQNTYNMMYAYVDDEHILSAIAVNNSVRGIFGFLASFAGSAVLDFIQKSGNTFMGTGIYAQQVLCAFSALISIAAMIFNKKVVSKQKQNIK